MPIPPLQVAGALFELSSGVEAAYGSAAGYDFSDESGLLRYTVNFVEDPRTWAPKPLSRATLRQSDQSHRVTVLPVATRSRGRGTLRQILLAAVHGAVADDSDPFKVTEEFLKKARAQLPTITSLEVTRSGAAQFRTRVSVDNVDAFITLVTLLLTNPEHREKIGHCKYCDKVFFVEQKAKRTGPPNRFYCDATHLRLAHNGAKRRREDRIIAKLVAKGFTRDESRAAVTKAIQAGPQEAGPILIERAEVIIRTARRGYDFQYK